jgi:hypothetical protein
MREWLYHQTRHADLDIYRAAKLLVDQHGEDAALHAAGRAEQLLTEGDA